VKTADLENNFSWKNSRPPPLPPLVRPRVKKINNSSKGRRFGVPRTARTVSYILHTIMMMDQPGPKWTNQKAVFLLAILISSKGCHVTWSHLLLISAWAVNLKKSAKQPKQVPSPFSNFQVFESPSSGPRGRIFCFIFCEKYWQVYHVSSLCVQNGRCSLDEYIRIMKSMGVFFVVRWRTGWMYRTLWLSRLTLQLWRFFFFCHIQ